MSFYDDQNFTYLRQSNEGKAILSKIISDNFYPYNLSNEDRTNYITGQSNNLKIIFVKILVFKSVSQDTVGTTSKLFYLTKTQSTGEIETVYYTIRCVAKDERATTYSARISLQNSDFISNIDGETLFSLVGDFNVSLSYPVNITIDNAASTSIPQTTTTPVYQTVATKLNTINYYENVFTNYSYFEYSNDFNFNFQGVNLVVNNNLFSTNNTIYTTTSSSGVSLRLNFPTPLAFSGLSAFGLTLKNTDVNYNPENNTSFTIYFRSNTGAFFTVNACEFLQNSTSGYYNIVFDFENSIFPGSFINYLILEIKTTNSSISGNYQITYMNFIRKAPNVSGFAFRSLSVQNNEYQTQSPFDESIEVDALYDHSLIKSSDLYSTVESLIQVEENSNYEITTAPSSVVIPENYYLKTNSGYMIAELLTKQNILIVNDKPEQILSIKILPPSKLELIDIYENSDYVLNGFYVKNPIGSFNFSKGVLASKKTSYEDFAYIQVDGAKYFLKKIGEYFVLENAIKLPRGNHTIQMQNFKNKKTKWLLSSPENVEITYDTKQIINGDKQIIELNLKDDKADVFLNSNSESTIDKIIIQYEI